MDPSHPPEDMLPLYRPDLLPLAGSAEARETPVAPSGDPRSEHLRRVPLCAEWSDKELRGLAAISHIVETPAGPMVTKIGTPGDSFFFIIDGRVSVQTAIGTGEPMTPGDFFGEISLLDGEPRSATV